MKEIKMDKVIFNNVWKKRVCNPIFDILNAYHKKYGEFYYYCGCNRRSYFNYTYDFILISKEMIQKFQEANKKMFDGENWDNVKKDVFEDKIKETSYGDFIYSIFANKKYPNIEFANFKNPIYYTNLEMASINFKVDYDNGLLNIKYDKPIKLDNEFIFENFTNNGNSELYFIFPYVNKPILHRGDECYSSFKNDIYNPKLNKKVQQFNFIALKISDMDGDGDVKFDHIDKIDYIDSLNITIKVPYAL
jgi:hypothetical protein